MHQIGPTSGFGAPSCGERRRARRSQSAARPKPSAAATSGIVVILLTMAIRKNIVVPAVTATLLTAWAFSGSVITGRSAIFNASLVAAKELFNIFLIIALVTAMLGALREVGADRLVVPPFRRVMRTGTSSFLVLAVVTSVISLFFWPTPAFRSSVQCSSRWPSARGWPRCRWAWSWPSQDRAWHCLLTTSSRSPPASPRRQRVWIQTPSRTRRSSCH